MLRTLAVLSATTGWCLPENDKRIHTMKAKVAGALPGIGKFLAKPASYLARNPVRPTGRGFRAKVASKKMRRMIRCESLLEMRAVLNAEFSRDVLAINEQPFVLEYEFNGAIRRYTPDFLFRWRNGDEWVVESAK